MASPPPGLRPPVDPVRRDGHAILTAGKSAPSALLQPGVWARPVCRLSPLPCLREVTKRQAAPVLTLALPGILAVIATPPRWGTVMVMVMVKLRDFHLACRRLRQTGVVRS